MAWLDLVVFDWVICEFALVNWTCAELYSTVWTVMIFFGVVITPHYDSFDLSFLDEVSLGHSIDSGLVCPKFEFKLIFCFIMQDWKLFLLSYTVHDLLAF